MNESKPDINKVLFMHLVSMLAMSAIQQMGKLVDPATGKAEINLEAAQATIDMLDMLELKTRGNLDAEETRLLKDTLMSLKMNYVQSQERKPDDRRRTTDDGHLQSAIRNPAQRGTSPQLAPLQAGSAILQTPNVQRPTPNAEGRKTEAEAPTTDGGGRTTDDKLPTTEDSKQKVEEDKTPKYHKKYE